MRPPANIVRQWMREKNSFPIRGLVLLNVPNQGWLCNIQLLRVDIKKLEELPPDEAAYEIALSAIFRYITSTVYAGESTPVKTMNGTERLVPNIAFEMAPFLVQKIKKLLEDGGGGLNVNQVANAQKFLARATTGSSKGAEAYGLPQVVTGAKRIQHRLEYEARLTEHQLKAMAKRRKLLARFWLKRNDGCFHQRGFVYSAYPDGMWTFNVRVERDLVEQASEDPQLLEALALGASTEAVLEYARSFNVEVNGETTIRLDKHAAYEPSRVPAEVVEVAARRVARRLLTGMKKHEHGVVSHKVIERALVLAWDPEDNKPLEDYPFPMAPTTDANALDRWALDKISERYKPKRQPHAVQTQPDAQPDDMGNDGPPVSQSWREELDIDDWVPLDEPVEDDETLDRKALEKADHDQSAALRRIRGTAGGRILPDDIASPVQHKVDYAGLPKDED